MLYNYYMTSRKSFLLILIIISYFSPLSATVADKASYHLEEKTLINNYRKYNSDSNYQINVFFSRKKVKDDTNLSQQELDEAREKAIEQIEARNQAIEEERLEAEKEENARIEAERLETERLEKEKLEAQKLESQKLEEEKAQKEMEAKLQAEKEAKEAAEKLEAERIENEKKLAEVAANRYKKEYLSDYIVPDLPSLPEDVETVYEPIPNPDETDASGATLLMRAAKSGNEWQLKRLLEAGADVNLTDKDGWTALMYAVRYNESLECTELLVNAKSDIKIKNKYGSSALVIAACYNNNPKVLEKLLKNYKASDNELLRAFVFMLSEQNISEDALLSKVNLFINMSIPLNSLYDGKTPLMYAALYGSSNRVLKILLDNGASAKVRSTEGKTAFDYAAKNKNIAHDETYWALNKK